MNKGGEFLICKLHETKNQLTMALVSRFLGTVIYMIFHTLKGLNKRTNNTTIF